MNVADAEEYTEALSQVTAGSWRQILLGERLGVPEALGLTTREWVSQRIGGYIRLSIPERREAVAELTDEGMSTREIADVLGVDQSTIVRDRPDANASETDAVVNEPQVDVSPEDRPDANASETDAVVDEPVPDLDNALTEALAESDDYQTAEYRKNLSRELAQVTRLAQHDPRRVVDVSDSTTFEVIDNACHSIVAWHEQIKQLRGRPLRVVEGGHQ